MAKTKPDTAAQAGAADIQDDEYRGMGGSYIFDPVTGKRTRNEDKQPAVEQPLTVLEGVSDESK